MAKCTCSHRRLDAAPVDAAICVKREHKEDLLLPIPFKPMQLVCLRALACVGFFEAKLNCASPHKDADACLLHSRFAQ
jgi:hypothetical protein